MKIVFANQDGSIGIIYPTSEALSVMTMGEIARKDVPTGRPFKIIQDEDVPTDRTFRDAWTMDIALLNDGVGL